MGRPNTKWASLASHTAVVALCQLHLHRREALDQANLVSRPDGPKTLFASLTNSTSKRPKSLGALGLLAGTQRLLIYSG